MDNAVVAKQPVRFATMLCGDAAQQEVLPDREPHLRPQALD
jgi:hypothetical protein